MKYLILICSLFIQVYIKAQEEIPLFKPPIFVELMAGDQHTLFKMVVTKPINHKLKFYNLLSYEVPHSDIESSIFLNQTVLFYDFNSNFSAGIGANLKTFGGLKPIVSVLYSKFTKSVGYIIQPTVEIHKDGSKELFGMFEYTYENKKQFQPYFRVDALATWKLKHDFSYTNFRLGLNRKEFRFGPGVNIQYLGPNANSAYNWGGFVNILIP